ncbi:response regulator [Klebsiella pneumoniae]|uniref:response regulator n=1 Tax=Klebsiella pneumoniae TaxID=573 RepID=UPI002AC903DB|nr:response regulator [Klebsiella pneumoniae]WPW97660.1 response regulator [Klebsiella pneumoniae]WPX02845.1 response regulator [Klebsiella pneumoniae]
MNSSNHNMSAVIIDDHPFARLALKTVLENQNIVVTGEAADDFHAIQLVDRLQPDIVIVDVMLIGSSGIDVVTKLRQNHYAGSIVMVSGKNQIFYRKWALLNK